jgi:membrane protein
MPYAINCLLFSVIYLILPNTRVKFKSALFAGIIAGAAFQFFQFIYINGQIFISKYNAIYGNFAALPLLLIWLQISFFILLFGAELSFAAQNVNNYDAEKDPKAITRRYKDFLYLIITNMVIKRFENAETPMTLNEIAAKNRIPIRLANLLLDDLLRSGILVLGVGENEKGAVYLPAFDINKMTLGLLYDKIEKIGYEDLGVEKSDEFKDLWQVVLNIREQIGESTKDTLIKDL